MTPRNGRASSSTALGRNFILDLFEAEEPPRPEYQDEYHEQEGEAQAPRSVQEERDVLLGDRYDVGCEYRPLDAAYPSEYHDDERDGQGGPPDRRREENNVGQEETG